VRLVTGCCGQSRSQRLVMHLRSKAIGDTRPGLTRRTVDFPFLPPLASTPSTSIEVDQTIARPRSTSIEVDQTIARPRSSSIEVDQTNARPRSSSIEVDQTIARPRSTSMEVEGVSRSRMSPNNRREGRGKDIPRRSAHHGQRRSPFARPCGAFRRGFRVASRLSGAPAPRAGNRRAPSRPVTRRRRSGPWRERWSGHLGRGPGG
jgi:hypothetical protein